MLKATIILLIFLIGQTGYAERLQLNQKDNSISIADLKALQNEDTEEYSKVFLELEEKYRLNKSRSELVDLYQLHASYLMQVNQYDSLINLLHTTRNLLNSSDLDQLTDIYLDIAFAHHFNGSYDSLMFWRVESARLVTEISPYYPRFILLNGLKSFYDGDYSSSIRELLEAISLFEAEGDLGNLALAYTSIALDYDRLGDFSTQREFLLKAIAINERIGDINNLILNYNNIGSSFNRQDSLSKALEYYSLAYDQLAEQNYPMLSAQNLTNRANILEKQGRLLEAEALFLECEQICEENNILYGVMLSNLNLGNLYRQMKNFEKSALRLEKGLSLALELKLKREVMLGHERLAWLWRDMGDYERAYASLSEFYTLKDSILNESVRTEALELKEQYEAEKKENEILTLSKEKLYQKFVIGIMGAGFLVLVFAFLWIRNKNRLAQQQKEEEAQKLKYQLEMKEKELLTDSIRRVSIMNTKESLAKELKEKISELPKTQAQKFIKIQRELAGSRDEDLLQEFETRFLGVYESFFHRLREMAPELTPTELRTAALIRLNFTSKDIAMITNRSIGTIDNLRSSIRKKLQLSEEENLTQKLSDI